MGTIKFSELTNLYEVREYLLKSAQNRRAFAHYTNFGGLEGMIRSSKLHLSKGTRMNDLLEGENIDTWNRTYIASFSHTFVESIAMWCVYSEQLSNTIRLQFLPSKIWNLEKNELNTIIYNIPTKKDEEYTSIGNPEKIFLCDVSYHRQRSLVLDGNSLSEKICPDIKDIMSKDEMLGFVKDTAWEYEKETRLCIILPPNDQQIYPDTIAIDFDGMNGVTVMGGPCVDTKDIEYKLNELKEEFTKDEKKKKILDSIKYNPDEKNCVSALKNKLYLPAFCSRCVKKDKCHLYKKMTS